MKNCVKLVYLLLLISLVFASCSKDKNDVSPTIPTTSLKDDIVGNWELSYLKITEGNDTTVYDTKNKLIASDFYYILTFLADGSITVVGDNYTWQVTGNTIAITDSTDKTIIISIIDSTMTLIKNSTNDKGEISIIEQHFQKLISVDSFSATPLEGVIPIEMQEKIKAYMPIYQGTIPPNIEGVYLVNPMNLVYSTIEDDYPLNKTIFIDAVIKFSSQNDVTHLLSFSMNTPGNLQESTSTEVSVSGTNNDFTTYFIDNGTIDGICFKSATVISGTKTALGIQDFIYSFVLLEKGADPENKVIAVGDFRVFKDGNNLASDTIWSSTTKSLKSTALISQLSVLSKINNLKASEVVKIMP